MLQGNVGQSASSGPCIVCSSTSDPFGSPLTWLWGGGVRTGGGEQQQQQQGIHTQDEKERLKKMGVMTALAIGLHNFPEGMAAFVATLSATSLGVAVTFAVAIHNIPVRYPPPQEGRSSFSGECGLPRVWLTRTSHRRECA
jgi:hypothetical protein